MEEKQAVTEVRQEVSCIKKKWHSLLSSRSMWGLVLFTVIGVVFTVNHLWDQNTVDFFKWLGGSFFCSRAADNLTNITTSKE